MERPFRELHELYKIVLERAEAQAKAEEERKKQEEEERKAEERANRGGKPYIPTRPYNPSDERQQTKPADKAPIAAPLEAEALEDAFEDMADGGF